MAATRRVDDVRAGLADESVLAEAVERLRVFTKSEAVADQLVGPVRQQIARIGAEIQAFQELASRWMTAEDARERLPDLGKARDAASPQVAASTKAAAELRRGDAAPTPDALESPPRDRNAQDALGLHLRVQACH